MKQGTVTPLWWGLWILVKVRLATSCAATSWSPPLWRSVNKLLHPFVLTDLLSDLCCGRDYSAHHPLGGICRDPGFL